MKISGVLLEAAERADRGEWGACYYINSPPETDIMDVDEFVRRDALHLFEELLMPSDDPLYYWGNPRKYKIDPCSEEDHNARILGILFAHQVAKDDEKLARKA
jgi:hypothetical protein